MVRLQTSFAKESAEGIGCRFDRERPSVRTHKKTILRLCRSEGIASTEILVQLWRQRAMERHPSRPAFELLYKQHPRTRVDIAKTEAQRLSYAERGAIQE
jgi:hypothetical protein